MKGVFASFQPDQKVIIDDFSASFSGLPEKDALYYFFTSLACLESLMQFKKETLGQKGEH